MTGVNGLPGAAAAADAAGQTVTVLVSGKDLTVEFSSGESG
jgi:hypothetical protein